VWDWEQAVLAAANTGGDVYTPQLQISGPLTKNTFWFPDTRALSPADKLQRKIANADFQEWHGLLEQVPRRGMVRNGGRGDFFAILYAAVAGMLRVRYAGCLEPMSQEANKLAELRLVRAEARAVDIATAVSPAERKDRVSKARADARE
jgi:hypothetical protein